MTDLLVERNGDLLVLTLNRPKRLNAMSEEMREGLIGALKDAAADLSVRAVLITGAGRGFCSGADLDPDTILPRRPMIERQVNAGVNQVVRLLRDLPVPVIAAVNGPAAGAGFSLALCADVVIAARSAKFHLAFVRIGAVLDGGISALLSQKIGTSRTTALAMLGGGLDAEKAESLGLVHKVVEDDQLVEESRKLASKLASGPTIALGLIKKGDCGGANHVSGRCPAFRSGLSGARL